jgi:hypothetical protein
MHNHFHTPHGILSTHRKLAVGNLKRCPVCGTVNAKVNGECFVCRWHGDFDHDPISVEEGLIEVLEQCPELIDCILYIPRKRESIYERARTWIRKQSRKRLDFEA